MASPARPSSFDSTADGLLGWAPLASLAYVQAYRAAKPTADIRVLPVGPCGDRVAAFAITDNIASSILPLTPWLTSSGRQTECCVADLEDLRARLGVTALWFRQLFVDYAATKQLMTVPGSQVSVRRPSLVIDWSHRGENLWTMICDRLGPRARRRARAFERRGIVCRAVDEAEQATSYVRTVELGSWKAASRQDLLSTDQFELYSALIRERVLKVFVAFDAGIPVAYRMDGRFGCTVFCVKYLFDEIYRQYSPGFYLIARNLVATYHDQALEQIDLFGGADSLKEAVATKESPRIDLGWGNPVVVQRFLTRGRQHDQEIQKHYATGRGLRYLYTVDSADRNERH